MRDDRVPGSFGAEEMRAGGAWRADCYSSARNMPVNGWMGLAFELYRSGDPADVLPLRRAAAIARHATGDERRRRAGSGELRRAAVEAQQSLLRHALDIGDVELVRSSGRSLRVRDFAGDRGEVEALLAVVRDARSPDAEVLGAAAALAALSPAAI